MTHSSDLRERLPRFKDIMRSIDDVEKQGGFEDISPDVLEYIKSAEPVGINGDGEIHLPDTYVPENGPPLLVLHPGESGEGARVITTAAVARTATRILAQSGWKHTFDASSLIDLKIPHHPAHHVASTVSTGITLVPGNPDEDKFTALIPRLVRMGGNHPDTDMVVALGHEVGHWGFYLNEAGVLQSLPRERLDEDTLSTISERHAYGISYAIERHLGYHATLKTPAELAERHRGLRSFQAARLREDVCDSTEKAGVSDKLSAALTALALTELYADPDVPATEDEVLAYKVTGLA